MSYKNKEVNVLEDIVFRQNLDRPMTAKELDNNFLKLGNVFTDVTNWINEIGNQVYADYQTQQNTIKNLNDAINGLGKDLENGLTEVDTAHTKTENDIKAQIADILKRLDAIEKKLDDSNS